MGSKITQSALGWLRETDTLTMGALKRAYWERLEPSEIGRGTVTIRNESHLEADEHAHVVSVSEHGIVHHCDCAHYQYRNEVCKHMIKTAMLIDDGALDLEAVGCFEDVIARAEPQTEV